MSNIKFLSCQCPYIPRLIGDGDGAGVGAGGERGELDGVDTACGGVGLGEDASA